MRAITILFISILLLCGCASGQKKAATKQIHERPWIGGMFERVATPPSVRTNAQSFAGHGLLITRLRERTPLAKAGIEEGDVALRINGRNLRSERDLQKAVDQAGTSPISIAVYRNGEVSEKTIMPGVERFQEIHHITFGIGVATSFFFDLYPNPDFSLVAIGYEVKRKRLELQDASARYRKEQGEYIQSEKEGWQGLSSEEGWKAWLGPLAFSGNKMVISQETAP